MATLALDPVSLARRPSDAGLLDVFGDDFDFDAAVVAAMEGEAGTWAMPASPKSLLPTLPVHTGATAANAPACLVAPVASSHRCVDPSHSTPCPWCARARTPARNTAESLGNMRAVPARAARRRS